MDVWNTLIFVVLPYAAVAIFLIASIGRYVRAGFQVSSLSSQFLESDGLFWGAVPFHIGLLAVLLGHVIAFLVPQGVLWWNGQPLRLWILEGAALACAFSALWGLSLLFLRRWALPRIRAVSTRMDYAIEALVLAQIVLGIAVALTYRWGSSWFAAALSPYLWSLVSFQPDARAVSALPVLVQTHIALAWVILGIFPYTRLMHVLVMPLHYIPRAYQQVIWNWDRRRLRDPATPWSSARPRNN